MDASPPEIGIVNFPGAQAAAILGMTDLLTAADQLARHATDAPERACLRVSQWEWRSDAAAPVRVFDTGPGLVAQPAFLVLPPALGEPLGPEQAAPYARWLREQHRAGTAMGSVCKAAFLLAEAGLLDGRPVTTHWTYECEFRERFPTARLDTDRLLIDDGDVLTAGGVMAWTDLTLRLVDRLLGAAVMLETARMFLIDPPGREQSYYRSFAPKLNHGDAAVLTVQRWLGDTNARNISLSTLVTRSGLEKRTFLRRFQRATGLTTTEYGQRLRVSRARELLEDDVLSADQVAWEVGYGDAGAFRKVFTRIVGLSPAEYRRRFKAYSIGPRIGVDFRKA